MAGFDYSSTNRRWQRLRRQALKRDGFRCQEAIRYGKLQEATHVHHIWPAEDFPEYAYCLWNLISLSQASHEAMHDKRTRKLTAAGLRWKNKTRPPSDPEG